MQGMNGDYPLGQSQISSLIVSFYFTHSNDWRNHFDSFEFPSLSQIDNEIDLVTYLEKFPYLSINE